MAWQKQHKENTKEKILTSAAALFTRHGFENVSINQVMENAQLTRGAFYAHFSSKSDLYAQAIVKAALLAKDDNIPVCRENFAKLTQRYLSKEHRDEQLTHLCPLAFLVTDINQQNQTVKDTYTQVFKGFVDNAMQITNNENTALQSAALMIGGLALSKAVNDQQLSDKLLLACQSALFELSSE